MATPTSRNNQNLIDWQTMLLVLRAERAVALRHPFVRTDACFANLALLLSGGSQQSLGQGLTESNSNNDSDSPDFACEHMSISVFKATLLVQQLTASDITSDSDFLRLAQTDGMVHSLLTIAVDEAECEEELVKQAAVRALSSIARRSKAVSGSSRLVTDVIAQSGTAAGQLLKFFFDDEYDSVDDIAAQYEDWDAHTFAAADLLLYAALDHSSIYESLLGDMKWIDDRLMALFAVLTHWCRLPLTEEPPPLEVWELYRQHNDADIASVCEAFSANADVDPTPSPMRPDPYVGEHGSEYGLNSDSDLEDNGRGDEESCWWWKQQFKREIDGQRQLMREGQPNAAQLQLYKSEQHHRLCRWKSQYISNSERLQRLSRRKQRRAERQREERERHEEMQEMQRWLAQQHRTQLSVMPPLHPRAQQMVPPQQQPAQQLLLPAAQQSVHQLLQQLAHQTPQQPAQLTAQRSTRRRQHQPAKRQAQQARQQLQQQPTQQPEQQLSPQPLQQPAQHSSQPQVQQSVHQVLQQPVQTRAEQTAEQIGQQMAQQVAHVQPLAHLLQQPAHQPAHHFVQEPTQQRVQPSPQQTTCQVLQQPAQLPVHLLPQEAAQNLAQQLPQHPEQPEVQQPAQAPAAQQFAQQSVQWLQPQPGAQQQQHRMTGRQGETDGLVQDCASLYCNFSAQQHQQDALRPLLQQWEQHKQQQAELQNKTQKEQDELRRQLQPQQEQLQLEQQQRQEELRLQHQQQQEELWRQQLQQHEQLLQTQQQEQSELGRQQQQAKEGLKEQQQQQQKELQIKTLPQRAELLQQEIDLNRLWEQRLGELQRQQQFQHQQADWQQHVQLQRQQQRQMVLQQQQLQVQEQHDLQRWQQHVQQQSVQSQPWHQPQATLHCHQSNMMINNGHVQQLNQIHQQHVQMMHPTHMPAQPLQPVHVPWQQQQQQMLAQTQQQQGMHLPQCWGQESVRQHQMQPQQQSPQQASCQTSMNGSVVHM